MEDEKIEIRNKLFQTNIKINNFSNQLLNAQLTLRKQNLDEKLMSKRLKFIQENNNPL
jgi:hypothetical protein